MVRNRRWQDCTKMLFPCSGSPLSSGKGEQILLSSSIIPGASNGDISRGLVGLRGLRGLLLREVEGLRSDLGEGETSMRPLGLRGNT
mmetsp:Transcript_21591/g.51222  ORF Transcript_21591/g.51222 Transcript_21591/m.51222 type:complete len:87 (-) Transcript_21591:547-807(-)